VKADECGSGHGLYNDSNTALFSKDEEKSQKTMNIVSSLTHI